MNSRKNIGMVGAVNKALPGALIATLIGLGVAAATLSGGCNTVEGAGKDIEKGGEKLQNAADR